MKIIYLGFNFLEKNIPKKNFLLFNSYPDFTDNSYALFEYILKKNKEYKLVWILNNKATKKYIEKNLKENFLEEDLKRVKLCMYGSLKSFYYFFKSKHVFSTHGIYNKIETTGEKKVNLWHGMPLKAIGNLDKRNSNEMNFNYDIVIATSNFFQLIMSEAFKIDKKKVIVTGQPRNDLLFNPKNCLEKLLISKGKYNKIIMWLPTFRKTIVNENWGDDGSYTEKYISVVPFEKLNEINDILKKKNFFLIIKLHPFDILQKEKFDNYSNIVFLKSEDLLIKNIQLYSLLSEIDFLFTDYSSIWIDFEILNRDIVFIIHDYKEYESVTRFIMKSYDMLDAS